MRYDNRWIFQNKSCVMNSNMISCFMIPMFELLVLPLCIFSNVCELIDLLMYVSQYLSRISRTSSSKRITCEQREDTDVARNWRFHLSFLGRNFPLNVFNYWCLTVQHKWKCVNICLHSLVTFQYTGTLHDEDGSTDVTQSIVIRVSYKNRDGLSKVLHQLEQRCSHHLEQNHTLSCICK